jgi:hypothetical protein
MRCVLTAERSLRTIALTLVATSQTIGRAGVRSLDSDHSNEILISGARYRIQELMSIDYPGGGAGLSHSHVV